MDKKSKPVPRCGAREKRDGVTLVCTRAQGHDDPRRRNIGKVHHPHRFELPGPERDAALAVQEVRQGLRAALASLLAE